MVSPVLGNAPATGTLVTAHDAAVATANGTPVLTEGFTGVLFDVSIATTATITFEGAMEVGGTFRAIDAINLNGGAKATTTTATGIFLVPSAGLASVRARISSWAAGAVTVKGRAVAVMPGVGADIDATLAAGDLRIGGVEVVNAADDTRAKVAATGSVAEGDVALAVQAPVLGVTTGAKVITDATGTVQQYLRGLVHFFAQMFDATNNWLKVSLQSTALSYHATGSSSAPAAAAVVADTDQMAAGKYDILVHFGGDSTAAVGINLIAEHRNAANGATLHRYLVPMPGAGVWVLRGIQIAANERVRVIVGATNFVASSTATADIQARISQ